MAHWLWRCVESVLSFIEINVGLGMCFFLAMGIPDLFYGLWCTCIRSAPQRWRALCDNAVKLLSHTWSWHSLPCRMCEEGDLSQGCVVKHKCQEINPCPAPVSLPAKGRSIRQRLLAGAARVEGAPCIVPCQPVKALSAAHRLLWDTEGCSHTKSAAWSKFGEVEQVVSSLSCYPASLQWWMQCQECVSAGSSSPEQRICCCFLPSFLFFF